MKRKTIGKLLVILSAFALANCGQSSGNAPSISGDGSGGGGGGGGGGSSACNPCKIFTTSSTYQGDFALAAGSSAAAADAACSRDSNKPNDGSTYKALFMSPTRDLSSDWVLHPNTTYVRADGTTVITSTDSSGKLDTLNFTNSIAVSAGYYWTGIKTGWVTNMTSNCDLWGDGTNSFTGAVGSGSSTGYASVGATGKTCDNSYGFYCVQQ